MKVSNMHHTSHRVTHARMINRRQSPLRRAGEKIVSARKSDAPPKLWAGAKISIAPEKVTEKPQEEEPKKDEFLRAVGIAAGITGLALYGSGCSKLDVNNQMLEAREMTEFEFALAGKMTDEMVEGEETDVLTDIVAPLGVTGIELALLFAAFRHTPKIDKIFRKGNDGEVIVYPKNGYPKKVDDDTWVALVDEIEGRRESPVDSEYKLVAGTETTDYSLQKRESKNKPLTKKQQKIFATILAIGAAASIGALVAIAATSPPEEKPKEAAIAEQEKEEEMDIGLWIVPLIGALACTAGAIPILWRREKEELAKAKAEFLAGGEANGKK